MTNTYEAMFLLDNQRVRESYKEAKSLVAGYVTKHGGKIQTARHWGERRLAYPIAKKNRATYLLAYCDLTGDGIVALRRDLELNESVLRYLFMRVDAVPESEIELAKAEDDDEFTLPDPPQDDAKDEPEPEEGEDGEARDGEAKAEESKDGEAKDGEAKDGEAKDGEAKAEESKDGEAKAADDSEGEKAEADTETETKAKAETKAETDTEKAEPSKTEES